MDTKCNLFLLHFMVILPKIEDQRQKQNFYMINVKVIILNRACFFYDCFNTPGSVTLFNPISWKSVY